MDHQLDIIIVGASIAGASLAALLRNNDVDCALVEAQPEAEDDDADPRALALTPVSRNILRAAGAWDEIPARQLGGFQKIHLCAEGGGEVNFDSVALGEPVMAYIVEQGLLKKALTAALNRAGFAHWRRPATARVIETRGDGIHLTLQDGQRLSAALLIAADGASSAVRSLAGVADVSRDYRQQALVCAVETTAPHRRVAYQKFLSRGPLALLPMAASHRRGVVWSTSRQHADELMALDEARFHQALGAMCDGYAGAVVESGRRACFPLAGGYAETYCLPRLALIGDAAHRVHPLAGQGANLGLLDAACLSETIVHARQRGEDFGALKVLRRYQRRRQRHNYLMMKTLEGLKHLFENKTAAVAWLRHTGMDIFDTLTPIKHGVVEYAMGYSGDLPAVARKPPPL